MTCIVGYVDKSDGRIIMGSDSIAASGWDKRIQEIPKVFIKNEKMIIGYTTSFRMGQLLEYSLILPEHPSEKSDHEYLCTDFINSVKKCFKDNDFAEVKNNVVGGGTFLVGYKGNIYKIFSDFQVSLSIDGYDACGCGESYALAAIYNLKRIETPSEIYNVPKMVYEGKPTFGGRDIVYKSLETAAYFSAGVSGPFNIQSLKF